MPVSELYEKYENEAGFRSFVRAEISSGRLSVNDFLGAARLTLVGPSPETPGPDFIRLRALGWKLYFGAP